MGDLGAFEEPKTLEDLRLLLEQQERAVTERARESDTRLLALENNQPDNAYRRKVKDGHHHEQPLEGFDDDASQGFGYQFNARYGLTLTRDSWPTNLRFDVDAVGAGFCYDFLVMPNWAGTEGRQFTKFDRVSTFRIYSTLQGAIDQAEADQETRAILLCGQTSENVEWDPGSGNNYAGSLIIHGIDSTGTTGNMTKLTGNFIHEGRQDNGYFLVLENFNITGTFTTSQLISDQVIGRNMKFGGDVTLADNNYRFQNCTFSADILLRNSINNYLRFDNCTVVNIEGNAAAAKVTSFRWEGGLITGSVTIRDPKVLYIDTLWTTGTENWYVKIVGTLEHPDHITIKGTMRAMSGASAIKDYVLFEDSGFTKVAHNVNIDLICEKPTSTTNEVHYFRSAMSNAIRAANIRLNCGVATDGDKLEDMAGGYVSVKGVFAQSTFMMTPCDAAVDLTGSTAGVNCIITGTDTAGLASVGDIDHDDLTNVTTSQHHTKYTDAEARTAVPYIVSFSFGYDPQTPQAFAPP